MAQKPRSGGVFLFLGCAFARPFLFLLPGYPVNPLKVVGAMPDKEINHIFSSLWLVFILIAGWGGVVRYLMDVKSNKATWSWAAALAQIVVSSFTGLIGGVISMESGLSVNMAFVGAGLCGAMGSVALTYFWERFFGGINENQR